MLARTASWIFALALAAVLVASPAKAQCPGGCPGGISCQVLNGGFETGDFSGWSHLGDNTGTGVVGPAFGLTPHGGSYQATFAPVGMIGAIYQTIPAHAGDTVNIRFWYAAQGADNLFMVDFEGRPLINLSNDTAHTAYTQFSYTVVASGDSPQVVFAFGNGAGQSFLDDVSVCIDPAPTCTATCPDGAFCGAANGGFETGSFGPWDQSGDTSFTAVFSGTFDLEIAPHGGSYASRFGPTSVGRISQVIPASIGDSVSISFWYAAFGATNSFSVVSDGHPFVSYVNDTTHRTWTQYTYSYTAISNNPTVTFSITNPPDYTFLDDINVCVVSACQGACGPGSSCGLVNGGFETGDLGGWSASLGSSRSNVYTGTQFGTSPHGGGSMFSWSDPLTATISQTITANAGDDVLITFWFKSASGTSNDFTATFAGSPLVALHDDTNHTGWRQFVFSRIAPASYPTLTFSGESYPGTIYLDDVSACVTPHGVCCRGATCNTSVGRSGCVTNGAHAGAAWSGATEICNVNGTRTHPCCHADYNKNGAVNVQDIFDMLNDWFNQSPYARIGGDGTGASPGVQSIFDFLTAWFAGGC